MACVCVCGGTLPSRRESGRWSTERQRRHSRELEWRGASCACHERAVWTRDTECRRRRRSPLASTTASPHPHLASIRSLLLPRTPSLYSLSSNFLKIITIRPWSEKPRPLQSLSLGSLCRVDTEGGTLRPGPNREEVPIFGALTTDSLNPKDPADIKQPL